MMSRIFLGLLSILLVSMGCQASPPLDKPPDIRYGEDACDQCRMIISEPRFAAAYVTPQGEVRRFDDIGDMVLFLLDQQEEGTLWVHDYETEDWLKADQAFFVISQALYTPMGYGVVALGDEERAKKLAAENQGEVVSFKELHERFASGEMTMSGSMHDKDMQMDMQMDTESESDTKQDMQMDMQKDTQQDKDMQTEHSGGGH